MSEKPSGKWVATAAAGEKVKAFVPNRLPPKLDKAALSTLEPRIVAAEASLLRLELAGEMVPSLQWFIYAFVRKEALLSSEIEGTQATLTDVFNFERTRQTEGSSVEDVEEVANYVAALAFARKQISSRRGLPISARLFNECHKRLMKGARGKNKQPGTLRRSQNWIGGSTPADAVFVPPPPEHVADLVKDLEKYLHAEDRLHPLLRAAACHAQFETIHPYLDGNGRLGRMLISLLLEHWGVVSTPLLYLSLHFKSNQQAYYRLLNETRDGSEWIKWFEFFLDGVVAVADDATRLATALHRQILKDRKDLMAMDDIRASTLRLFELLPSGPVVTSPYVIEQLDYTAPTAGRAIAQLESAGVLVKVGDRQRDRAYAYQRYLDVLAA